MTIFTSMHEVLTAEVERLHDSKFSQAQLTDLRRSTRKKYDCIQLIAPYDGRKMPTQAEFHPHKCHDISPTGFSFWLDKPVTVTHLIVALGEVPFLFFVVEIVHQAYEPAEEPGGWRIGCRFIRRVER